MAYKFREELVGKRFLSVSGFSKLKVNKISEWGWRPGVIRAASHRDNKNSDLQILVEYDDVEWQKREWLQPYKDSQCSIFLIERGIGSIDRHEISKNNKFLDNQNNNNNNNNTTLSQKLNYKTTLRGNNSSTTLTVTNGEKLIWPVLTYYPLIIKNTDNNSDIVLNNDEMPIEYMQDKKIDFINYDKIRPLSPDWEMIKGSSLWGSALRQWIEMQDGQSIFLTTPSVLVGFRVEVYRSEGTTQWYTAVIVGYNEATKDLTVTDDTVLEDHSEDPCLVQMRLIGDGVVESIMRGEVDSITPRRSRSSMAVAHNLVLPKSGSGAGGGVRRPRGRPVSASTLRVQSLITQQQLDKEKTNVRSIRKRRISENSAKEKVTNPTDPLVLETSTLEDRENKGPAVSGKLGIRTPRTTVLEETNTSLPTTVSKLRKRLPTLKKSALDTGRTVRRRTRLESKTDLLEDSDDQITLDKREHRLTKRQQIIKDEKDQDEETDKDDNKKLKEKDSSDPLVKRLRAIPERLKREFKEDRKVKPEDCQQISRPVKPRKEIFKPTEEEDSESRERDREPEPPPSSLSEKIKKEEETETVTNGKKSPKKDFIKNNLQLQQQEPAAGTTIIQPRVKKEEEQDQLLASRIPSSKGLLLESSRRGSETGGVVLDRLSPLGAGNRLLLEQERSRHNESPVILVERLNNKPGTGPLVPAPAAAAVPHHHSHHQQHPIHHPHHSHHYQQYSHHPVQQLHYHHSLHHHPSAHHPHQQNLHLHRPDLHHRQLAQSGGDEVNILELEATATAGGQVVGIPVSAHTAVHRGGSVSTNPNYQNASNNHVNNSSNNSSSNSNSTNNGTFGDSSSDSGVSSLRSTGSGDERSGSRSSALSAEDTTATSSGATTSAAPAKIWHVQSVQHTSLLMSHSQSAINAAAAAAGSPVPVTAGYPVNPAVVAAHHHPSLAQEMLWRAPSRLLAYPPGLTAQPSLTEVLERDRHERILRERREAEVREIESREREAKVERERLEKQRAAEQAVHKHFEESLRLAQQKRNAMQTASTIPWNSFMPLVPPPAQTQSSSRQSQPQLPSSREERESEVVSEYNHQNLAYLRAQVATTAQITQVSRASSVPVKIEYPPPAHSRSCKSALPAPSASPLPKAEPNVSLFGHGYPSYGPKPVSSVIVKNEAQAKIPSPGARSSSSHRASLPQLYATSSPQPKPKVSSPAPSHIYGKPAQPQINVSSKHQAPFPLHPAPPPAHSGKLHLVPQISQSSAQNSSFQMQPLDLGVERSRLVQQPSQPLELGIKKRKVEENPTPSPAPVIQVSSPQSSPQPSPQASIPKPSSSPLLQNNSRPPSRSNTITPTTPNTAISTNTTNSSTNSSNTIVTTTSSYPVHKLKKAWLQRHSGEDGSEDTTGVVGSGSCVTLPLTIVQTPANDIVKDSMKGSIITASTTSSTTVSTATNSNNLSSVTTMASSTSLPSAVNSIHNIGSMAVNSINKTKMPIKAFRKPVVKEAVNGHANNPEGQNDEDSSNSEAERKAAVKRKPPKVKRKKGAWKQQNNVPDQRRRKKQKPVGRGVSSAVGGAQSDSSNESEAGSVSDSSEQPVAPHPVMEISTGNGKKIPRKRGRKPRIPKDKEKEEEEEEGYQPRQKKKRLDKTNSVNNKNKNRKIDRIRTIEEKPEDFKLKKSGQSFVQDKHCLSYTCIKITRCRECRMTPNQRNKIQLNAKSMMIFCRFYAFRRIQFTKSGKVMMAGFNDPHIDADEDDTQLWLPGKENLSNSREKYKEETQKERKECISKADFDIELAYQVIRQVGDQFCDLLHQEKSVLEEYLSRENSEDEDRKIIWKRVVKGTREMCDICETTLFNYHWTCSKCGFVVCIDCYEARKNNTNSYSENVSGKDKYSWLLCANRTTHVPEELLLTQVIPSDCLIKMDKLLHECRREWGITQHCSCENVKSGPANEILKNLIKGDLKSVMNGSLKVEIKEEKVDVKNVKEENTNGEEKNSLNWLADVALQNQDKDEINSDSESDDDQDGNYSTLRELLIRPSQKSNGSGSRSNSPLNNSNNTSDNFTAGKVGKKSQMDTLNEVISSVIEHSVKKEDESESNSEKSRELKHFVRRYKWVERGREPLPVRFMTLTESLSLYPEVPHSWLCKGKLLRLHDSNNPNNYRIFQDQWKRGQPVIVSDVHKSLDPDLWHPDSFYKDFGDYKNDLVNCLTGNTVPKQYMWKFWEGFENISKRLKDDQGNPMLLKLKDWPSRGDFADILPTRFSDLMKALPLSEYTHRYGRLNLTSRLPDIFTKPDLGPKMYNAYGSPSHPDRGTTNLHLDVSDAVNVMVYVGVAKDIEKEESIKEVLKAIDEAGCDNLTKNRVREKHEIPGALWHIYAARDADKIRDMLNAVALERGARLEPHHDPIHDQSFYLDETLRTRLYKDYGVEGYSIVQCLGDAVFVPAGAPHQVRNLLNCIKVAEDFVSPENISHCFHLTQEFRALSDTHTNHEDKLQIKNIVYHAVKDSLTALDIVKTETLGKLKSEKSDKGEKAKVKEGT